jgi:hypothetical protein
MMSVVLSVLLTLRTWAHSRAALQLEILALRHQLQVLQRTRPLRVRLAKMDRCLWSLLSRIWTGWRTALVIVKPETVIAWHRRGFRLLWTWKSRHRIGRPAMPADVRMLIRTMAEANPQWGAPRIHGELLKLGIDVCQATVAKYMRRRRQPPSQTWRTFLRNHVGQIVAADFFVVPTVIPPLVRPGAPRSRSATHPPHRGHRTSDGGVDGPTTARGVSVERGASLPPPRSR